MVRRAFRWLDKSGSRRVAPRYRWSVVMLTPQVVRGHVLCWPPPSWQSGLASWSMFFLGVSCRGQPDRLTVIEDKHLNQTGHAAMLPDRRRLGRSLDPRIKPERHSGGFHFGTLTGHRSRALAQRCNPSNVLRYAVRLNAACSCNSPVVILPPSCSGKQAHPQAPSSQVVRSGLLNLRRRSLRRSPHSTTYH